METPTQKEQGICLGLVYFNNLDLERAIFMQISGKCCVYTCVKTALTSSPLGGLEASCSALQWCGHAFSSSGNVPESMWGIHHHPSFRKHFFSGPSVMLLWIAAGGLSCYSPVSLFIWDTLDEVSRGLKVLCIPSGRARERLRRSPCSSRPRKPAQTGNWPHLWALLLFHLRSEGREMPTPLSSTA